MERRATEEKPCWLRVVRLLGDSNKKVEGRYLKIIQDFSLETYGIFSIESLPYFSLVTYGNFHFKLAEFFTLETRRDFSLLTYMIFHLYVLNYSL